MALSRAFTNSTNEPAGNRQLWSEPLGRPPPSALVRASDRGHGPRTECDDADRGPDQDTDHSEDCHHAAGGPQRIRESSKGIVSYAIFSLYSFTKGVLNTA